MHHFEVCLVFSWFHQASADYSCTWRAAGISNTTDPPRFLLHLYLLLLLPTESSFPGTFNVLYHALNIPFLRTPWLLIFVYTWNSLTFKFSFHKQHLQRYLRVIPEGNACWALSVQNNPVADRDRGKSDDSWEKHGLEREIRSVGRTFSCLWRSVICT